MLKKIKSLVSKRSMLEETVTPQKNEATFAVTYENRLIGTLELEGEEWKFTYSDVFKQEHFIAPLFDFPDVSKAYVTKELWPFFAGRIPGLKQPEVKEAIRRENIDKKDIAGLLARFGKRTIINPFIVERQEVSFE